MECGIYKQLLDMHNNLTLRYSTVALGIVGLKSLVPQDPLRVYIGFQSTTGNIFSVGPDAIDAGAILFVNPTLSGVLEFWIERYKKIVTGPWKGGNGFVGDTIKITEIIYQG